MKLVNGVFVLAAVVLLAGCSSGMSPPEVLNREQPVGSPFTKYLSVEYNVMAHQAHGVDVDYFARKGMAAVDGVLVQPESLQGRDIQGADAVDMAESRGELITLLNGGGRDRAPDIAAVAQTRFDCWTQLQGGTFLHRQASSYPGEGVSCKDQFHMALNSLKQALDVAPPPVMSPPDQQTTTTSEEEFPSSITSGPRGAQTPVQEQSFLVFFDWDRAVVSPGADDVLETVAHEIKGRDDIKEIIVGGYTDTSGGEKYNMKLSLKRADAVRHRLVKLGIPENKIRTVAHGENDLLVKTPAGVREPQNRRAQITFE